MVKDLRSRTGLTQKAFAARYHIPLQTLKQWESAPTSSCFRRPPEYVVFMLDRLVSDDFATQRNSAMSRAEYLIRAASHSRYNAGHWMRYLRKELIDGRSRLTQKDIDTVLSSDKLTMFQKVSFKRAMQVGTETNLAVSSLNRRVRPTMLDTLQRKYAHD